MALIQPTGQACHWVRQPDYIEAHRFALKEAGELIDALPHLKKMNWFERSLLAVSVSGSHIFLTFYRHRVV